MSEPFGNSGVTTQGTFYRLIRKVVDIKHDELVAVLWSWLCFFSLLSAHYILKPIRDEIGVAQGLTNMVWMFSGTLILLMLANSSFAALVVRMTPVGFISTTFRFFMVNVLIFILLLEFAGGAVNMWAARIFFMWDSVFSLFIVSVFWGFMVDVFSNEQSLRLFGLIAAGGTIGGIVGSGLMSVMATSIGRSMFMLCAAVFLEVAVFSIRRLSRVSRAMRESTSVSSAQDQVIGGSSFAGFTRLLKSSYLLNLCFYMALFYILSTFLYLEQAMIVQNTIIERAQRTAFFARVDLAVNAVTLFMQLFLIERMMRILGITLTLTLLPALSIIGFGALGIVPTLWMVVIFQALRRAGSFAIAGPAREVLFTVVPREDKYKAKNLIDTFVSRSGDQIGAWSFGAIMWLGSGVSGSAFAAVPVAAAWLVNAIWLGRRQERLAEEQRAREARELALA